MSRPASPPSSDLPFLVVALALGFQGLVKRLNRESDARQDIALGMGSIFFALCRQDGCIMKDLAQELRMPKGTLSGLVARMESLALVERTTCDDDGRALRVRLTRKARQMEPVLRARHRRTIEILQSGLTAAEVRQLSRLIGRLLNNLDSAATRKPAARVPRRKSANGKS